MFLPVYKRNDDIVSELKYSTEVHPPIEILSPENYCHNIVLSAGRSFSRLKIHRYAELNRKYWENI